MAPSEKVNRGVQIHEVDEWGVPIPSYAQDLNGCGIMVGPFSLTFDDAAIGDAEYDY